MSSALHVLPTLGNEVRQDAVTRLREVIEAIDKNEVASVCVFVEFVPKTGGGDDLGIYRMNVSRRELVGTLELCKARLLRNDMDSRNEE